MKKNRILLIGFLALTSACVNKKSPEILLTKWKKNHYTPSRSVIERKLATARQSQCLEDVFTPDNLREEMLQLEKNYEGMPEVKGQWRHLQLANLSIPQANFLAKYGSSIGDLGDPGSIDYSSCEDVPCIFNKIYGQDDSVAGYVHYLWYLKFGFMLSADNFSSYQKSKTPGIYDNKKYPLSAYLYNKDELFRIWRLILIAKQPFTRLKTMVELQKIPRGAKFEEEQYKKSCGLAHPFGLIEITDECLTTWSDENYWTQGAVELRILHELTHVVDFEDSQKGNKSYGSLQENYLKLAGFDREQEYVLEGETKKKWIIAAATSANPLSDEEKRNNLIKSGASFVTSQTPIQKEWLMKNGSKPINNYSSLNPIEHYAELSSNFRIDVYGDRKNISSEQASYISEKLFDGEYFDEDSLIKNWIKYQSPKISLQILKIMMDCSTSKTGGASSYFKTTDFRGPVTSSMLNCIGRASEDIADSVRASVTMNEPEGCWMMKGPERKKKWENRLKAHLSSEFDRFFREIKNDKQYLDRLRSLYSEMSDKTIAYEIYLDCHGTKSDKSCYDDKLQRFSTEKISSFSLSEEQTNELIGVYINSHPFAEVKNEVTSFYSSLASSHQEMIQTRVESAWSSCLSRPQSDSQRPTGKQIQLNGGYMVASLYNCLTTQIPEVTHDIVRSLRVDGLKVEHSKEETLLTEYVSPVMKASILSLYQKGRDTEISEAKDFMLIKENEIKENLISDLAWTGRVSNLRSVRSNCEVQALRSIDKLPYFHTKKDLYGKFLGDSGVCGKTMKDPRLVSWVSNSNNARKGIVESLKLKVLELGRNKARECLEKYPTNNFLKRYTFIPFRNSCLKEDWEKFEDMAIDSIKDDPEISKFKLESSEIRENLGGERKALQNKVMEENGF